MPFARSAYRPLIVLHSGPSRRLGNLYKMREGGPGDDTCAIRFWPFASKCGESIRRLAAVASVTYALADGAIDLI